MIKEGDLIRINKKCPGYNYTKEMRTKTYICGKKIDNRDGYENYYYWRTKNGDVEENEGYLLYGDYFDVVESKPILLKDFLEDD